MQARTALAVVATLLGGCAGARAEMRGVVELFTSQGCSSCPPADALMGKLAADPSLVVMTFPVDYWDYLGWKDTLARPQHAARQRGYAAMRGDRDVYTPQAIVNGMTHVVGSDHAAIEEALGKARFGPALSATISAQRHNGQVTVSASESAQAGMMGEVWLLLIAKAVPVAIARGENRGRSITYHNVVRRWVRLGDWGGHKKSWTVPTASLPSGQGDGWIVVMQGGSFENPGPLLAANKVVTH